MDDTGETPDRELIAAVRQGDMSAFEALYRRYLPVVRRVVAGTVSGTDLIDDAIQDVFVKAMEQLPNLRDPDKLQPWLKAIARNAAIDVVRVKQTMAIDDIAPEAFVSADISQHELAEVRELVHLVQGAFTQLSPRDLRAVALVGYLDASTDEIAERLDITPGAAKVVLHRARGRLRNALKLELLVRQGAGACGDFAYLVEDKELTSAARHLTACVQCQRAGSVQIRLYDAASSRPSRRAAITVSGENGTWTMPLIDKLVLGRALDDVGGGQKLVIDGDTVSRHHGELHVSADGREARYVDTSTNGTLVNDQLVQQSSAVVRDGDVVAVRGTTITFHAGEPGDATADILGGRPVVHGTGLGLADSDSRDIVYDTLRKLLNLYAGQLGIATTGDFTATWDPEELADAIDLAVSFAIDAATVASRLIASSSVRWAVSLDDPGADLAKRLAAAAVPSGQVVVTTNVGDMLAGKHAADVVIAG